ncbi:hypothetical protein K4F52_004006 [Lecanicillium sp. MT-2017a]|nr:hypothetical protein K4F52_004006 [Lecanicillium sp. MT-2017a]
MDDPGLAWPAWKFGMKREDLFTTLHDKYNTFTFTLQDPEAFHHDVYELSCQADTEDEFHSLMADRQRLRSRELNESLESLAVEIIANPMLMGTEQWQHALQLFRTKSYDSIVRYFGSYLPEDYLPYRDDSSTSKSSSYSEADSTCTASTKATSLDDVASHFLDDDDFFPNGPVMTVEPCSMDAQGPLSPPHSETEQSDASENPSYPSTGPPSRSMSFSGSESGRLSGFMLGALHKDDDTTSQSDSGDTAITSVCDSVESISSLDIMEIPDHKHSSMDEVWDDDDLPLTQFPEDDFDTPITPNFNDTLDSDTPTPRQFSEATSYVDLQTVASRAVPKSIRRSPSPKSQIRLRNSTAVSRTCIRRTREEALSKIQKAPAEAARRRPRERTGLA